MLNVEPCRVSGFLFLRARKSSLVPPSIINYSVKEMESFPYTPLDVHNHGIRLLHIWAEIRERDESLCLIGFLDHVSLIDGDRYDALSYCWGDSTPSKLIKLQPYSETTLLDVPITENLNSALWALLRRAGGGNIIILKLRIRLWVDAICP